MDEKYSVTGPWILGVLDISKFQKRQIFFQIFFHIEWEVPQAHTKAGRAGEKIITFMHKIVGFNTITYKTPTRAFLAGTWVSCTFARSNKFAQDQELV